MSKTAVRADFTSGVITLFPTNSKLVVAAGTGSTHAINKGQLDVLAARVTAIEGGSVTLTTVEAGDGTVALPSYTFANDLDTGFYLIGANNTGYAAAGAKVLDISATGLAVTGALSATTTVTATTGISLGTDLTGLKEVDHVITVTATTTAATAGGAISILSGTGGTTGAGGVLSLKGGAGSNATTTVAGNSGATTLSTSAAGTATTGTGGNGGAIAVTGVAGGAANGAAGIGGAGSGVTITTGAGGASSSATGGVPGIGGGLTITAGNGGAAAGTGVAGGAATAVTFTTGTGGASTHASGGAGGAGAALTVTAGNGGAVTNAAVAGGVGGAIAIVAGNSGAGSTAGAAGGAITVTAGNGVGTAGIAGNIVLTPGTTSVTTVAPTVISSTAIIQKNTTAPFFLIGTTASDGAFAKSLVGGYCEIRGATGNVQMPTAAQIVTAIGTVTAGTRFEFVLNAIGSTPMTAGNTATVTANTGLVINASVGHTLMTITGTSNVQIGKFAVMFDSATTCILSREA